MQIMNDLSGKGPSEIESRPWCMSCWCEWLIDISCIVYPLSPFERYCNQVQEKCLVWIVEYFGIGYGMTFASSAAVVRADA